MARIGRNQSPLFKLVKHMIVVFGEVYILFNFSIRELYSCSHINSLGPRKFWNEIISKALFLLK
jgi:hypothetical protein